VSELEQEAAAKKAPHWWHRVTWSLLLPRFAVAVTGVGALVVGLKAAWEHDAATPALVVAGVLIALALIFAPDLTEFGLRYKEGELTYRRESNASAYVEVSDALQVALRAEGEDSLRAMITEIAEESTKAAVRAEMETQLSRPRSSFSRQMGLWPTSAAASAYSPLVRALALAARTGPRTGPAEAIHRAEGESVTLTLKNAPATALACEVTIPSGRTHRKVLFRLGAVPVSTAVEVKFPDEFGSDVPGLEPGPYKVEWRSSVITLGAQGGQTEFSEPVASEEFEIPEPQGENQGRENPNS